MKRILLVIAILVGMQVYSSAQDKQTAAFQKKAKASDEEIADSKKASSTKTWIKRATLFQDIADAPTSGLWVGMSEMEYKVLNKVAPLSENYETIGEDSYNVWSYEDKDLYFNQALGKLDFWKITKYAVDNPLAKAKEAYDKVLELDPKAGRTIKEGLERLSIQARNEGSNFVSAGDYANAFEAFKLSLACSDNDIIGKTDTLIIYYAGVTARYAGKYEDAIPYLKKAMDLKFDQGGAIFVNYGDALSKAGKKDEGWAIIQEGISKYPENQELMSVAINYYMETDGDPSKILDLVRKAQAGDPQNPSLYYVEGWVYEKLNKPEEALGAYQKAIDLDDSYFVAHYAMAAIYYNKGVQYNNDANGVSTDNEKEYDRLKALADAEFNKALPHLLTAYEYNSNEIAIIQSLKEIYFRFRGNSDEMMEQYTRFNNLYKEKTGE